jgi:glycosyltransferase involved in cell wall biosynthesis
MRGGERVLEELARLYPSADLYTLVHVPGSTSPTIENLRIYPSPLSRIPGVQRHYRKLLPLYPWAIGQFRLEGYDLVISTHHAVAKSIPLASGTPHLSYCFTPMRYIWDQADAYLGTGTRRLLATPLVNFLQRFDVRTSGPENVTRYVAASHAVADRIRRHYSREAEVVWPPVRLDSIVPDHCPPDDFYLMVGGFVPYKAENIAIEAFRGLDRRLVVAGDGPSRARLQENAPPNVEFRGRVEDSELANLYARCRALIHPQHEDFGICAVEAQAAGRPVIAYAQGGARETIVPLGGPDQTHPTGVWFEAQTSHALRQALARFELSEASFRPAAIRAWAEHFSPEAFAHGLQKQIAKTL